MLESAPRGGGVCYGEGLCLLRGGLVPGWSACQVGGVLPGGPPCWGGGGGFSLPETPLWTESQMPVKTLPWVNFVAAGNDVHGQCGRVDFLAACVDLHYTGILLTVIYSSTNMSKSVWTSGFWKPLVHKNIYSINFQSQNQTLKDRKMKNVALFWQFADTFQPCWPSLLWTFCKLCSDWASFTKQLIRIQLLDLFGVTSTFRKRKLPDKENSFRSFKSLKITK